jgi:hypothetical protein
MGAYATIQAMDEVARRAATDDASLDQLVAFLGSTDGYTDQEDGGYASTSARSTEITVAAVAQGHLVKLAATALPRLLDRFDGATGASRAGLVPVLATANVQAWAAIAPDRRARALGQLDQVAGPVPRFATLTVADHPPPPAAARARDRVALRDQVLLSVEAGALDRAVDRVMACLLGPSQEARLVADETTALIAASPLLARRLVDALLDPRRTVPIYALAIRGKVHLDATQRARLVPVVADAQLGDTARAMLAPYLDDPLAEAEVPLRARLIAAIAAALVDDANEGSWRAWIQRCGRDALALALVPAIRARLASRAPREELLQHMRLLGAALAPLGPDLVPYLAPTPRPTRLALLAVNAAEALASPATVPALIALLTTELQREALQALANIGPPAAAALPAIRACRRVGKVGSDRAFEELRARALAKLGG